MVYARKRFGQNFLVDQHILLNIIQAIAPQQSDHIVGIGAGRGALTDYLIEKVKRLDLIEIDRDLVNLLQQRYAHQTNVSIHSADVLSFVWEDLIHPPTINQLHAEEKQKKEGSSQSQTPLHVAPSLRLVGNLPYNISTPLLMQLFTKADYFHDMFFLLQKEVAERICAKAGDSHYGRLSVITQLHCKPQLLFTVPPEAFNPIPKVNSALVYFRLHPSGLTATETEQFLELIKAAFAHRRKTIANNLKSIISADMLLTIGIKPSARPQEITLAEFIKMSHHSKVL